MSSVGDRFRLRSSVEPIVAGDGSLYLLRAGDDDLVIREPDPVDCDLLERLAHGEPSVAELAGAVGLDAPVVAAKLDALATAGVIVPAARSCALDPADAERYARQLPYLADLGDERDLQRALGAARVVVIGCGGLGTWVLAALAAAGVRRLRLVDDDVVERSNLNRQVLYAPADLGSLKVDAAAAWLRAFDERIEVETLVQRVDGPAAANAVVHDADAVVLAADAPPFELARWINAAGLHHGVPFITAGQVPPLVKIGPLYRPGITACFTCHERALRSTSSDYDAYVQRVRGSSARATTLGPASGIAGTMLAMEIMHLLAGAEPATAGAALLLDLRTLIVRRERIARDPTCPDCAGTADYRGVPARVRASRSQSPR
jgi:bacteriocin biosynthesis cyclodehydratase domain-containing protein